MRQIFILSVLLLAIAPRFALPPPPRPATAVIADSRILSNSTAANIAYRLRTRPFLVMQPGLTMRQTTALVQGPDPLPQNTQYVVIAIGTADFHSDVPTGEFAGNYNYEVESARVKPGITVICVGLWSDPTQLNAAGNASAFNYSELIKAYSIRNGARYVDLFATHADPANVAPDGTPSVKGQAAIARLIEAAAR